MPTKYSADSTSTETAIRERDGRESAPLPPSFSRSEFRFVAAFAIVLCILTSLPYWAARHAAIPGKAFTGLLVQSFDSNNYLAYSRQAADGQWLFRNPMTPEPHKAVFFNLEWLRMGKVTSLLHVSLTDATDLVRVVSIVVMCFAVYWLSIYVLQDAFIRRMALVAIMAGGGFGWIVAVHLLGVRFDSSYFLDLTNANLFPFYWALRLAHFLISETFIFLGSRFFCVRSGAGGPFTMRARGCATWLQAPAAPATCCSR